MLPFLKKHIQEISHAIMQLFDGLCALEIKSNGIAVGRMAIPGGI